MTFPWDRAQVAAAFDRIAPDYDAAYLGMGDQGGNAAMRWMRQESLALLRATFPPGSRLLEIGCGTGDEAVALAREGRTVLATDISPGMVDQTRAKAVAAGVEGRVDAVAIAAAHLASLAIDAPFDGAYASFGALNCEPDLHAVGQALDRLVRPGGKVVLSVMGRTCLFEIAWYLAHGRPGRAFRRLRGGWHAAPVAGRDGVQVSVPTRYLAVGQLRRAMPSFYVERMMALPLLLPPPYAASLYRRWPRLHRALQPIERCLRGWPLWRRLGDHTVLILGHRQAQGDAARSGRACLPPSTLGRSRDHGEPATGRVSCQSCDVSEPHSPR